MWSAAGSPPIGKPRRSKSMAQLTAQAAARPAVRRSLYWTLGAGAFEVTYKKVEIRFGLVNRHQSVDVHCGVEMARCFQGLIIEGKRLIGSEGLGRLVRRLAEILYGFSPLFSP